MIDVLDLGASLYIPGTKPKFSTFLEKNKHIRSVIIDTEDSIHAIDIPFAEKNIEDELNRLSLLKYKKPFIFLRVKDATHLKRVKSMSIGQLVDGFVLPKYNYLTAPKYNKYISQEDIVMPILENELFEQHKLDQCFEHMAEIKDMVLCARVGITDIFNLFSLRRPKDTTIYQHPLGASVITDLLIKTNLLKLKMSGPVFESYSAKSKAILIDEVRTEVSMGIYTKSTIHPDQIVHIEEQYRVSKQDFDAAQLLISKSSSVFGHKLVMQEIATHMKWAETIIKRADVYGTI
jgi:citrate lyase beta subunit